MKTYLELIWVMALMTLVISIHGQSSVIYASDFTPSDTMGWGADSDLSAANMPIDAEQGWALSTGPTPTANTGPNAPQAGTHYAYFEHSCGTTSGPCPETEFSFVSPEILLSGTSSSLSFYYLLYGDITGLGGTSSSLQVNILTGGMSTSVFTRDNGAHAGGTIWSEEVIDLSAYDGQTIRVEFVAIEGTITNSQGDIGIDTLSITAVPNNPIPTLGEWGLILLLISMLNVSILGMKQRRGVLACSLVNNSHSPTRSS